MKISNRQVDSGGSGAGGTQAQHTKAPAEHMELTTRTGLRFYVRPAHTSDEAALADFFSFVTAEDLRFRFLSGLKQVDHDRLIGMLKVDHDQTETFLAFDQQSGTLIAAAMLAADRTGQTAEVAISMRSDYKHRGVGWSLLAYISQVAKGKGIKALESMESRENHEAIDLERDMGFKVRACPDDPSLVILALDLA